MKYKYFNITELMREPKTVLPEVEKAPVTIRRQNKEDLVLMTATDFHKMFDVAFLARSKAANSWDSISNNVSKK